MFNKKKAIDKYNEIIKINLETNFENYIDPDQTYEDEVSVYGNIIKMNETTKSLNIRLSSDGLCSMKKIEKFSYNPKEVKENYKCIRKGMFECLVWPSYAQSINQMRGLKTTFDDRLDSTLNDIQKFYKIVFKSNVLSVSLINEIWTKCILARAYLNLMTFTWLCSFNDFDSFITNRKLQAFVDKDENGNFEAKKWTDTEDFDKSYFEELIKRIKEYKGHY